MHSHNEHFMNGCTWVLSQIGVNVYIHVLDLLTPVAFADCSPIAVCQWSNTVHVLQNGSLLRPLILCVDFKSLFRPHVPIEDWPCACPDPPPPKKKVFPCVWVYKTHLIKMIKYLSLSKYLIIFLSSHRQFVFLKLGVLMLLCLCFIILEKKNVETMLSLTTKPRISPTVSSSMQDNGSNTKKPIETDVYWIQVGGK